MPSAHPQTYEGNDPAIAKTRCLEPLKNSGSLEKFEQNELTPVIGTEFIGVQAAEWLDGDEQLIRDLAITGMLLSGGGEVLARKGKKQVWCLMTCSF